VAQGQHLEVRATQADRERYPGWDSPFGTFKVIGPPGQVGSYVPLYGSGRNAINEAQLGHMGGTLFYGGMFLTDLYALKSAAVGVVEAGVDWGLRLLGLRSSTEILEERAGATAIKIAEDRLAHVIARHTVGGSETYGKSLFAEGEDVVSLIRGAESINPVRQAGGRFQRIVEDAGRIIGVDIKTGPTATYTVITDAEDNLITAFPGRPGR